MSEPISNDNAGEVVYRDEVFQITERMTPNLVAKLGPGDYVLEMRVIEENGKLSSDATLTKDGRVLTNVISVRVFTTVDHPYPEIRIVEITDSEIK